MQMKVSEAKAHLSRLIAAAERGEEVVITRGGKRVVRLQPIEPPPVGPAPLRGSLAHLRGTEPDFLAPMDEDELADWEGRGPA